MSFFVFVILANLFAFANSQSPYCLNNGNYTSNSTYATNLNTLLASLPTNVDQNGFYNASVGRDPDRANAMVLCRGDVQLDTCRNCVVNATAELPRSCAYYRQATLWNEFCMLRYSDENMFGTMEDSYLFILRNTGNASSPSEFEADLRILVDDLRGQASNGGGGVRKVAFGNRSTSDFQTIYALLQCTPDLSPNDCSSCLAAAGRMLPQCCDSALGVRILMPSCNLRYETETFYNETRLRELEPVAVPPSPTQPAPTQPAGSPPNPPTDVDNTTRTTIIVVVSVAGTLLLGVFLVFLIRKRMAQDKETKIDEISNTESLHYDFGMIRSATDDFSEAKKLGQGGFGAVYRGKLPNGQEIAVKRLSINSGQGDIEFKNEVMLLSKLQHRNLVRLLGFSLEGEEKLLIYEYVPNGSLDQFLFVPTKRSLMDWDRRYKIIGGIARGILYLHEDSRLRIIHRDLKPNNVLLDEEMNPKISDFGMARLFVVEETQGTSKIAGTRGYMAPEYVLHGLFSVKSDVFSFGVVILETISGQKNTGFFNEENGKFLLSSAWENWHKRTPRNLIDPVLVANSKIQEILRCIHIALLCVQENAADRPTMASVITMLNSFSIDLPEPLEPSLYF